MLLSSIIFTTAFLAVNHLYSTFASPMVSKDGVAVGHSLNMTHSLAKRDWAPPDQKCRQADDWVVRRCQTLTSDLAWEDLCVTTDGTFVEIYTGQGFCPFGTICINALFESIDPFDLWSEGIIVCIARPTSIMVLVITTYGLQQNGVEVIGAQTGITDPSHTTVSVTLKNRIPGASVSAFLEGTYCLNPSLVLI
jgi:hypothetical protein